VAGEKWKMCVDSGQHAPSITTLSAVFDNILQVLNIAVQNTMTIQLHVITPLTSPMDTMIITRQGIASFADQKARNPD